MNRIADFLSNVWSRHPQPGYGTIAQNYATDTWHERYVHCADVRLRGSNVDDLYFTPCVFSRPNHRGPYVLPSRWLYADLDEVDPRGLHSALTPTLAWETSPARFRPCGC